MSEKTVEKHKVVTFTYTILDEDGNILEKSDMPMEYMHGMSNGMFTADMQIMEGAKIGDTRDIVLPPDKGFGHYDESKTYREKLERVPKQFHRIGAEATFQNDQGAQLTMRVVSMDNGEIFMDGNHPFAGKTVTFRIKVTDIRDATLEEVGNGFAASQMGDHAVH